MLINQLNYQSLSSYFSFTLFEVLIVSRIYQTLFVLLLNTRLLDRYKNIFRPILQSPPYLVCFPLSKDNFGF